MTDKLDGPRRAAASGKADSLVIFLHGYGANGDDLIGLAQPLAGVLPNTAFASPHAPEPCRAAPMGKQWFPIPYIDGSSEAEMTESFNASVHKILAFIDTEAVANNVMPERVALVGFSQGAMLTLHVGLRHEPAMAALVGFSGRLLMAEKLESEIKSRPPVLLVHGDSDEVVTPQSLPDARDALVDVGVDVKALLRPGLGHGIDNEGLTEAAILLRNAFTES